VPAAAARKSGIEVIETFFSTEVAASLIARGFRPDIVIANNVLAHVPDPSDLAAGIALLAGDHGRAVVEVHSLMDLIGKLQFDTIYHEHSSYFSATSVEAIFRRHGLALADVERISLQGGSLRLYFERGTGPSPRVSELLAEEARSGVADGSALHKFARQTTERVAELRQQILSLVAEGRRIAAYGAAAKGTMLLNHIGLDERTIPFVADRNPHKQGRRVPGVRIPIVAPDRLFLARPDFVLLLPWNLRDEILPILEPLRRQGTRIMVPLPDMEIV
jgi:hypothetical protein